MASVISFKNDAAGTTSAIVDVCYAIRLIGEPRGDRCHTENVIKLPAPTSLYVEFVQQCKSCVDKRLSGPTFKFAYSRNFHSVCIGLSSVCVIV